jgi:hypothetical protein
MKKKYFAVSLIAIVSIIITLYFYFQTEIKYYNERFEVLDTFSDTTDEKIYRFYFVNVSNLDSNFINYASEKTIEKTIQNTFNSGVIIAHFYKLEDTLKLPENLFEKMRFKYPNKKDVDKNLRYIVRGAVKSYFCDSSDYQSSLFYNHLIIPKYGISARDVLK